MADVPVEVKKTAPPAQTNVPDVWQSFRSEMDRLFDCFGGGFGSMSNIRRRDGKPNPPPKQSNSRSISLRKDCHTSGTFVCAGGAVFFTSTGTSAIAVSVSR